MDLAQARKRSLTGLIAMKVFVLDEENFMNEEENVLWKRKTVFVKDKETFCASRAWCVDFALSHCRLGLNESFCLILLLPSLKHCCCLFFISEFFFHFWFVWMTMMMTACVNTICLFQTTMQLTKTDGNTNDIEEKECEKHLRKGV